MKNFFKSMWYGIKASFKEKLTFVLIFAFGSIAIGISGVISGLYTDIIGILFLVVLIGFILGIFLLTHYLRFLKASEYAKKHNVSFDIAWINTEPDDDEDCF